MADEKKLDKGYLKVEELGFMAHEYLTADELKAAELADASAISFEVETGVDEEGLPVREAISGSLEMAKGDAAKVIAVVAPFISKCPKFVWESSDPEVVAVSDNTYEITDEALIELLYALKAGEATITISSIPADAEEEVLSASFSVEVSGEEESVEAEEPGEDPVEPQEPSEPQEPVEPQEPSDPQEPAEPSEEPGQGE